MAGAQRYALNKSKYLLPDEVQRLEQVLKSYLSSDRRNTTLLFLALFTGARATELLNLRREDLDVHEQTLFIRGIKGSSDRELPIPSWLFKEVQKVAATAQDRRFPPIPEAMKNRIYPITYNRVRQIWQHYRPVHKKFHCLRHTFAIRLYRKTKDIRLLQMALGHRNITNTMIYADYVYSQQELRRLIL